MRNVKLKKNTVNFSRFFSFDAILPTLEAKR